MPDHTIVRNQFTRFTSVLVVALAGVILEETYSPELISSKRVFAYENSSNLNANLTTEPEISVEQPIQSEAALKSWQQVVGKSQQEGNLSRQAQSLLKSGQMYLTLGQTQAAIQAYQQGINALEELNSLSVPPNHLSQIEHESQFASIEPRTLQNRVDTLTKQTQSYLAQQQYSQALPIYRQILAMVQQLSNLPEPTEQIPDSTSSTPSQSVPDAKRNNVVSGVPESSKIQVIPETGLSRTTSEISQSLDPLSLPPSVENSPKPTPIKANQRQPEPGKNVQAMPQTQLPLLNIEDIERLSSEEAKKNLGTYQKALEAARAQNNPSAVAKTALSLGYIALAAEKYKEAMSAFEQASQIYRQNDRSGAAISQLGLSRAYLGLQNSKKAFKIAQEVKETIQEISDPYQRGSIFLKLSDVYYALGQTNQTLYEQAFKMAQQAQAIFAQSGDRRQKSAASLRLANLYYFREQYKPALKLYQEVQKDFHDLGDRSREISASMNLGYVYLEDPECYEEVNCYEAAKTAFNTALDLLNAEPSTEQTTIINRAKVWLALGDTYLALKNYDQAISYSKKALEAFQQLNEQSSKADKKRGGTFASEVQQAETTISDAYLNQERYNDAFDVLSRSQSVAQQIDAKLGRVPRILKTVRGITSFSRFLPIPFLQQVSSVVHSLSSVADDMVTLTRDSQALMGRVNAFLSQQSLKQSLKDLEQERNEAQSAEDRPREAKAWIALGKLQRIFAKYSDSENSFKSALRLAQQIPDKSLEAEANLGLASSYQALGKSKEAQIAAEQARQLFHSTNNTMGEANALLTLGSIALGKGEFERAQKNAIKSQELFQQSITAEQEVQSSETTNSSTFLSSISPNLREARLGIAQALLVLSSTELNLNNYESSQKAAIKALNQFQRLGDRTGQANAYLALASAFQSLGQYGKAMGYSTRALFTFRNLSDRAGESSALNTLGNILAVQKRNEAAIRSYQLSERIEDNLAKSQRQPGGLARTFRWIVKGLNALFGWFPDSASNFVWKATGVLETVRGAVDLAEGAGASVRIGDAYLNIGEKEKARKAFEDARRSAREQKNPSKEAAAWLGLSNTELNFFDNPQQAFNNAQKANQLFQKINDRVGYAYSLLAQGTASFKLGQRETNSNKKQEHYTQALVLTQASLALFQSIKDKAGEAIAFATLGDLQSSQTWVNDFSATYTAIPFYKKSVELTEEIRRTGIRQIKYQASYVSTVSETYRRLAELLLKTNNLIAAQQVLELLKIQELEDYGGTRAMVSKTGKIDYSELEKIVLKAHQGSLMNLGKEIAACDQNCPEFSTLNADLKKLVEIEFTQPLKTIATELATRARKDPLFYDPTELDKDASDIINPCGVFQQQEKPCPSEVKQLNTAMIYPLVRENKLWLLWTGKGKIAHRYKVDVNEKTLRDTVFSFYNLLSKKGDPKELQKLGRQLYDWFIQPLEQELNTGKINNLVFALDQFTRYIPMATLVDHEGKYLIERYSISTVVSAKTTDMGLRLPSKVENTNVLALGQSGGETILQYVKDELTAIVKPTGIYPGKSILEQDFTKEALEQSLQASKNPFRVLHIATHGKFDPNVPQDSYLMTHRGKLTVSDIEKLNNLERIHLVVLSACETGLGQTKNENGIEIPALSFSFMKGKRAKSVMATLWAVNDRSTSQLMSQFYKNLASSNNTITKAQAIRQAQLFLLKQQGNAAAKQNRRDSFKLPSSNGASAPITDNFSHPYYWAPFVLIGNGL